MNEEIMVRQLRQRIYCCKKPRTSWAPTGTSRVITCFTNKHRLIEPDWHGILHICERNQVKPLEKDKDIDGQRVIYTLAREESKGAIRQAASRANLRLCWDIAFPSRELEYLVTTTLQGVVQSSCYHPLFHKPGIYVVFDRPDPLDKKANPLYVGQTINFLGQRFEKHQKSQREPDERAGFAAYMYYYEQTHKRAASDDWFVCFFALERCREITIQAHLIPDLETEDDQQQMRAWIAQNYDRNTQFALDKAERALIAHFHPHFNQTHNIIRRKLEGTDYCLRECRLCNQEVDLTENHIYLTDKQCAVLTLLDQGYSKAEVAQKLTISLRAASWHISWICKKLQVIDITQALSYAKETGLLFEN